MRAGPYHRLAAVSVAAACLGCGTETASTPPTCEGRGDEFFAGLAKPSADGRLIVELVFAEPAPPANTYTNKWALRVTDAVSNESITGGLLVAGPYMVDHGHGAPNVIGSETAGGDYIVDPLSLKMNGLWDVTIKVTPVGGIESRTVFSFCVRPL